MFIYNKRKLEINGRYISHEDPTFIIAEIGVNHNGDIEIAKELIDKAKFCGVDAVKFQSFKTHKLFTYITPGMTSEEINEKKNLFEFARKLELSEENHHELKSYCEEKDILFFSTSIDIDSFKLLRNINVPLIKIASCDLNNFPLLKTISKYNIPVIISTGMSYLSEVFDAVKIFEENNHKKLALLHCVSNYPPAVKDLNLNNLVTLSNCFEYPIGFSDHTMDLHFSIAAVAMGACIIERHFTLDQNMDGPDHHASLNPEQLTDLVRIIREIEKSKGSFIKKPVNTEKESIKNMRRSIVAEVEIPEDTIITENMVELKRPATGLSPKYLNIIIGRKAKRLIHKDEMIKFSDIK